VEHRAAHDHGLVAGGDETDGDELDAVRSEGFDLVFADDAWLGCRPEHGGDVGAVDVGVDEADLVAELGKRDGEVDGDGGLADTAFAGADGDDVFNSPKGQWWRGSLCVSV